MAKIQFLTIFLTVAFFLGGVVSVTDKELQVRTAFYLSRALNLITVTYFFIGTILNPFHFMSRIG